MDRFDIHAAAVVSGELALHRVLAWWLTVLSIAMVVGSLILIPAIVVRLPEDYLVRDDGPSRRQDRHPVVRILLLVLKNLCGLVLLAAGIVMSLPLVPGQGILTMVIGLTLLDLPGKRAIERAIIAYPPLLRAINRLCARRGCAPIRVP